MFIKVQVDKKIYWTCAANREQARIFIKARIDQADKYCCEINEMKCEGMNMKEISTKLGISYGAVRLAIKGV